jgi:lipid II:glycine glycyltransferase (peptidoglycan interpeptide bridge formation enzyme)
VDEYVERRGLFLRIIPPVFAEETHAAGVLQTLQECGFKREASVAPYRTLRVDLRPEPELIRRRLDGKWRNQLNAAERHGLTVTEGTDDELYAPFLGLYDEMMARKRFDTTVDPRHFRRIQARLVGPEKMLIMLGARDGVPQTGLVATAVGETGMYLLGATSNDGLKSKGSYLLQWRMMNRLRERGCCWYDLGGINPETNPGVYHFKQGLGGQECRQLGRFSAGGAGLAPAIVTVAERFRSLVLRFKRKA